MIHYIWAYSIHNCNVRNCNWSRKKLWHEPRAEKWRERNCTFKGRGNVNCYYFFNIFLFIFFHNQTILNLYLTACAILIWFKDVITDRAVEKYQFLLLLFFQKNENIWSRWMCIVLQRNFNLCRWSLWSSCLLYMLCQDACIMRNKWMSYLQKWYAPGKETKLLCKKIILQWYLFKCIFFNMIKDESAIINRFSYW